MASSSSHPADLVDAGMTSDSTAPHLMRITSHGKIHNFVRFALDFIEKNPNRPLVLHTIPPTIRADSHSEEAPNNGGRKRGKLGNSTNTVPRLISVVEIIKREFLIKQTIREHKAVPSGVQERPPTSRLHQYNHIGVLEGELTPLPDFAVDLKAALNGRNHIQIKRTPYMKVFLALEKLSEDVVGTASYQEPLQPAKKSRAAKARERKRRRKIGYQNIEAEADSGVELEANPLHLRQSGDMSIDHSS